VHEHLPRDLGRYMAGWSGVLEPKMGLPLAPGKWGGVGCLSYPPPHTHTPGERGCTAEKTNSKTHSTFLFGQKVYFAFSDI
jgi:hypothetical protein